MRPLDWYPAPYEPHGSTSGEGAWRLLGRPRMDPLTVLMRETLQNSWDARLDEEIDFYVHLRRLTSSELSFLRDSVFAEGAENVLCEQAEGYARDHRGLRDALEQPEVRVLEIGDRGTSGLGGPLRADRVPAPDEPTDFIDFVFNLGAPRDTRLGGGTYGFGKTISYVVSRAQTVAVATRAHGPFGSELRAICASIGRHWGMHQQRYTGRHWWGRRSESGLIGPVVADEADALVTGLGVRPFDDTGTSLLVLDPDLGGRTDSEAIHYLVDAFVWNLWPKLVPAPGADRAPIGVSFELDGANVPVPDPVRVPGLAPFVHALRAVRSADHGLEPEKDLLVPPEIHHVTWGSGRRPLGTLALTRTTVTSSAEGEESPRPFDGPSRHVALMRQAELVVEYVEGPASSYSGFEWGGVFRCLPEVDDHFASAEPPAHDTWEWHPIADEAARTHVRTALRKVRTLAKGFANPLDDRPSEGARRSVAHVADRLRGLVLSVDGTAPTPRRSTGSRSGSRRPTVRLGRPEISYDAGWVSTARGTVEAPRPGPLELVIRVSAHTDTGPERSAPMGGAVPRLRHVSLDEEELNVDGSEGRWQIHHPGTPLDVTVSVVSSEPVAVHLDVRARQNAEVA